MNPPAASAHRSDAIAGDVGELLDAYARTHEVGIRLWRRAEGGWETELDVPGVHQDTREPGETAAPVEIAGPTEFAVEVFGTNPGAATRSALFLAAAIAKSLRYQEESRFFGRELAERYEEITLLYTISEILGSVISLEEAARTILSEVCDTMGVQRAALWIHDPATNELQRVAAVGEGGQGESIQLDDDSSMTAAVFRARAPMMLDPGEVFPRDDQYQSSQHDFFLSVPVSYSPPRGETRTIGVINLIGRTVEESFSAGDQKLVTAIASQIGAAVENSRLVADSVRQERLGREMELAHDLQLKLLPSTAQFRDFCQVAARCSPAESVGGDFYHLFRLPGGRLGVMIGDVSSHGFAAALIMALTMSAVAIHASEGDAPAQVLRRVHAALIEELENTEMYLTLFYGVIDPAAGTLTYANAGHSHAFRIQPDGAAERLGVTNPPLGLLDHDNYGERSVDWRANEDLLFLFTDGLSDSLGTAGGEEILVKHVSAGTDRPLEELLNSLFRLHGDGRNSVPPDDRSAVLLRV